MIYKTIVCYVGLAFLAYKVITNADVWCIYFTFGYICYLALMD